ncbi:hypothetical protein [Pseudomonas sp. PONIH3]|uniref:hypothetical protein n=1 Tax=Pseudomonas sp. PONIH3 TaxID=1636610 RepID=UPI000CDCB394|nr:hypothetical protein [Pseudomonas sp. PONIH3]AUY34348.1 hypothetical protein C3F42_14505 [Pseudomonas sp. PONIH3]
MSNAHMLKRFQEEVMKQGCDATLPSNLNDFWIDELQRSLEQLFEGLDDADDSDSNGCMSLPLVAIIHILFAKNEGLVVEESMEDMFRYFEDYRIELALEVVRRKTCVQAEPATIKNIFTNRQVRINS